MWSICYLVLTYVNEDSVLLPFCTLFITHICVVVGVVVGVHYLVLTYVNEDSMVWLLVCTYICCWCVLTYVVGQSVVVGVVVYLVLTYVWLLYII